MACRWSIAAVADQVFASLAGFANSGFPESVGASLEGQRSVPVLRLGLGSVRGVGDATAERIVDGRPWSGGEDLVRRAGVTQAQLETLAAAGALDPVGEEVPGSVTAMRRRLLWAAGAAAQSTAD